MIETAILFLLCRPLMGVSGRDFMQHSGKLVVWMALAMAVAFFAAGIDSRVIRLATTIVVMGAVPIVGAFVLLDKIERENFATQSNQSSGSAVAEPGVRDNPQIAETAAD